MKSIFIFILIFFISLNGQKTDKSKGVSKKSITPDMVYIKGGTFRMGLRDFSKSDKNLSDPILVKDFNIGKYEITQFQYESVMGSNPSFRKGENLPVETVSWFDAVEFCNKLSILEGLKKCYYGTGDKIMCKYEFNGYRLPTEAEWEYAARGGSQSKEFWYSGSSNIDSVAEYKDNNSRSVRPVGGKKSNELGIYDMSGNVWEWCKDFYGSNREKPQNINKGKNSSEYRVVRGGDWTSTRNECLTAIRNSVHPNSKGFGIGFRIARNTK